MVLHLGAPSCSLSLYPSFPTVNDNGKGKRDLCESKPVMSLCTNRWVSSLWCLGVPVHQFSHQDECHVTFPTTAPVLRVKNSFFVFFCSFQLSPALSHLSLVTGTIFFVFCPKHLVFECYTCTNTPLPPFVRDVPP